MYIKLSPIDICKNSELIREVVHIRTMATRADVIEAMERVL